MALGFTEMEATVYAYLIENSPATGYRAAQDLDKPIANTYKAIKSLQHKGAVIADDTGTKLCRAVPYSEVLTSLESAFDRWRSKASTALSRLQPVADDEGVYSLGSRQQVLDRVRTMLGRAEDAILLDAFPGPLEAIAHDVVEATRRGVTVTSQIYGPTELEDVEFVLNAHAEELRRWPGDWLNLVCDGSELLLAFMPSEGDGVHQALWSRSPFLCWAYQSALAGEILAARLEQLLERGASTAEMTETIARFSRLKAHESVGYKSLAERFQS